MGGFRWPQQKAVQWGQSQGQQKATQWGQSQGQSWRPARQGFVVGAGQSRKAPQINYFDPNNYVNADDTTVSQIIIDAAMVAGGERGAWPSDVLRQALVAGGVPEPTRRYPNQAHHIVESANEKGQEILEELGIASNSAANGVFLPTKNFSGIDDLTTHLGSHVGAYTNCVNEALDAALKGLEGRPIEVRKRAVVTRLGEIRRVLLTNVVPLNGRVDPDYNPRRKGPMTIRDIFEKAGLFKVPLQNRQGVYGARQSQEAEPYRELVVIGHRKENGEEDKDEVKVVTLYRNPGGLPTHEQIVKGLYD